MTLRTAATRPLLLFTLSLAALLPWAADGAAAAEMAPRPPRAAPPQDDPAGARVIVKFKLLGGLMRAQRASAVRGGAGGPQMAAAMSLRHGLALVDGRVLDASTQVVRGDRSLSSAALAARLAADDEVEYAVPDRIKRVAAVPNDPLFAGGGSVSPTAGQWYLRAPDSTLVSAINAQAAWDVTAGSAGVVVADVDTGVLLDHPDLVNKLHPGYDFVSADNSGAFTRANDGNGRDPDPTDPGDWCTSDGSDSSWHGTQTSSLIGAQTNNGIGMASVGNQVMVLPVRALGKCGGFDSDIIAGMLWGGGVTTTPTVNAHPARVVNLSLGGSGSCTSAWQSAVNQLTAAGVVVVVAAGNDEGIAVGEPANCSGVVTVAGLRHAGTKVGYSNVGPEVALAAPAGNCVNPTGLCVYPMITATNSGTTSAATHTYSDGANYAVGTSFAAPLVSGTAALMLSANPALTPAQVKQLLQSSARPFPTTAAAGVAVCHAPNAQAQDECICTTSTCGAGMLDARAAVVAAAATARPTASIAASATTVERGTPVSFNAGGSMAPSGRTIAGYAWAITSGGSVAQITGSSTGPTVSVATLAVGTFTIQLTVTDSAGQQSTQTATVTVNPSAAPAVSIVASTLVVDAGRSVGFEGSASPASGQSIVSYQWTIVSGSASFTSATNASSATLATAANASGSVVVRLTVTDSAGRSASSDVTLTINPVVPTAVIAPSATSVAAGASVTFDGSGSTAAGGRTIAGYQWAITGGSNIASFSGPTNGATVNVVTSGAGSLTVQLTVTDSAGVTDARSATVTVINTGGTSGGTGGDTGGGGGGGASSAGSVVLLALAAAALGRRRRG